MQRFGVGRGKVLIYIYMHVCAKLIQSCLTLGDLVDHSLPGSVHGILHQDYWSELFALFQGIFLTQGLNPHLPRGQVGSFPLSPLFAICLKVFSLLTKFTAGFTKLSSQCHIQENKKEAYRL